MKRRILIIDDDNDINNLLFDILSADYDCIQALSARDALGFWAEQQKNSIDLVLLDLMLPDIQGEQLIHVFRVESQLPIIVLTAKGDTHTLVDVLDLGADDYIAKPFKPEEIKARVKSHLRRFNKEDDVDEVIERAGIKLFPRRHEVYVAANELKLPLKEYELLHVLMLEAGKVVTKENLYNAVWGEVFLTDDNTINVHVSRLRAKLKATLPMDPIETVWGVGFRFRAED